MNEPIRQPVYLFESFRLDAQRRVLHDADGLPITLTPRLFDTLLYFVERSGQLLTKEELLEALWPNVVVEEHNLNKTVSELRRLLGEKPGEHKFIVTKSGRGYRFVADVAIAARPVAEGLRLDTAASETAATPVPSVGSTEPALGVPRRSRYTVSVAATLIVVVIGAGAAIVGNRAFGPAEPQLRLTPWSALKGGQRSLVWSPDGRATAFIARGRVGEPFELYVRSLDEPAPRLIASLPGGIEAVARWTNAGKIVYWDKAGFWSVSPVGAPPEHIANVDFDRFVAYGPRSADVTPDGSALATIGRTLDGEVGIWTATLPGAKFERYEPGPLAAQAIHNPPSLRFSPDGRQLLLFWNAGPERGEEVWLMPFPPDANRPAQRVLERLPLGLPGPQFAWLPDNRHIVVATGAAADARRGLYLADTESGAFRQFSSGPADQNLPAVSPDGERLVFTEFKEDFDIVTVDLQTANVTVPIATERAETMPAWAAAKDALVWVTDINGGPEIWLREPSRPDRPLVTARDFPTSETQFLVGPALSPDGARVIYQRVAGGGSESYLWMSAVGGGAPQRVTNAEVIELAGAWSPDGRWYVYRSFDGGFRTLKVSTAGLAEPQTLFTDPKEGNWLLAWSPDGEWILDLNRGVLLSADGERTRALGVENRACAFASTELLYCFRPPRSDGLFRLVATDFDGNVVRDIGAVARENLPGANVGPGLRLSPTFDGTGLTYSVRRSEENLWLMEGLATVDLL